MALDATAPLPVIFFKLSYNFPHKQGEKSAKRSMSSTRIKDSAPNANMPTIHGIEGSPYSV